MDKTNPQGEAIFSARLNFLFDTIKKADGTLHSNREVARVIGISPAYISRLRSGEMSNPGYDLVGKLAEFFNVPVSYFYETEGSEEENESKRIAVNNIALRASKLDDQGMAALLTMLETIEQLRQQRGTEEN